MNNPNIKHKKNPLKIQTQILMDATQAVLRCHETALLNIFSHFGGVHELFLIFWPYVLRNDQHETKHKCFVRFRQENPSNNRLIKNITRNNLQVPICDN